MSGTLRKQIAFEEISKPPLLSRSSISQSLDFDTLKEQAIECLRELLYLSVKTTACHPMVIVLSVSMNKAVPVPDREVESFHWRISLLVAEIEGEVGAIWQHLCYSLPIG